MLCNSDQQRDDYQPPAIPFQARTVGMSENPGERVVIQGLLKEVLFLKLKIWWELPSHCSDGPASWYVGLEASEQQPRKGSHAINWLRCQISSRILALLGNIKCADSGMEPSDTGRMSAEADEPKDDDETRRNWKIDTYSIAACVAEGKKLPHCSVPWLFCCPLFVLRTRNSLLRWTLIAPFIVTIHFSVLTILDGYTILNSFQIKKRRLTQPLLYFRILLLQM